MKAATVLGILLIVSGIVGLALGGFRYTHEKKEVVLGPRQVSHKEKSALPISPILSTLSRVAGSGLAVVGTHPKCHTPSC